MKGNKTSEIAIQFRQFAFSFSSTTIHQQEAARVMTVPCSIIHQLSITIDNCPDVLSIKTVCFEVGSSLSEFVTVIMVCGVLCVYNVNILMTRKQIILHLIILPSMDPVSLLRHCQAGCWWCWGKYCGGGIQRRFANNASWRFYCFLHGFEIQGNITKNG